MNQTLTHKARRAWLAGPALAGTAASMLLTVAVVALWLGPLVGGWLAVLIGLGFDGAWLAALAYERRLAAVGDHDRRVTLVGWLFGLAATGLLVAHGLTAGAGTAAWLAVSWLPLAAKLLWWLHGLWEATEVSPRARVEIARVLQESRDTAALSRASLNAAAGIEVTRAGAVSQAGARMAKAQGKAARVLATAQAALSGAAEDDGRALALESIAAPRWEVPAWTPVAVLRGQVAAGDRAAEGPAGIAAQVTGPLAAAPAAIEGGVRVSTAAGTRYLLSVGVSDQAEIVRRLPEVTGRPVTAGTPGTVARVIRDVKAAEAAKNTRPAPTPYL